MANKGDQEAGIRDISWNFSAAEICRAFEQSWQTSEPKPVEAFIDRAPEEDRQALLFGLLRREISYRRLQGDTVTLDEYLRRFPDERVLLAALFTSPRHLRSLFDHCGYELSDRIEAGRTGDVYRAIRRTDRRLFAVKVIPAFLVRPDAFEGDQVVNLDYLLHRHIARPTELVEAEGNLLLFNDYIEGMNFLQIVDQFGKLPPGIACELTRQVAQGLAQLHDHFKAHGALTPTTLVLSVEPGETGLVKLGSVGLTDVADLPLSRYARTHSQTELDWRIFAAPEIADNASVIDARGDVCSLGCILQYLLSGRRPRDSESPKTSKEIRVLWSTATSSKLRRAVPRPLEALIAQMTAEDPEARFACAGEVVDALERHADGDAFEQFVPKVEHSVAQRGQLAGGVRVAKSASSDDSVAPGVTTPPEAVTANGPEVVTSASSTSAVPNGQHGWPPSVLKTKWAWIAAVAAALMAAVFAGRLYVGDGGEDAVAEFELGDTDVPQLDPIDPPRDGGGHENPRRPKDPPDGDPPWSKPTLPVVPRTATLHTLAVGVSTYQPRDGQESLNLELAAADAIALNQAYDCLIRRDANGKENPYGLYRRSPHSRVLTNRDATRGKIIQFIEDLQGIPDDLSKDDLAIVSLSGHGVEGPNDKLYFLPYEFDPSGLLSTAVDMNNLISDLGVLKFNVLLIIDTCHSGAAIRGSGGMVAFRATMIDYQRALERMTDSASALTVLAAGKAREKAGASRAFGGHGALTAAVLEFLTQERLAEVEVKNNMPPTPLTSVPGEGFLTIEGLRRYVSDRVQQFPYIDQSPFMIELSKDAGNVSWKDIRLRRTPKHE